MSEAHALLLDLREMEPPEPFVQSLAALERLGEGQYLHLTHHRAPMMLYPELQPRGFVAETLEVDDLYHIFVWAQADALARQRAEAAIQALSHP